MVGVAAHAVADDLGDRSCAPRARACSSSSSTRMPAPSPMTKPSRSASKGRLALLGLVVAGGEGAHGGEARRRPWGVMAASRAAGDHTSASARAMILKASPMEWALVAQAVHAASFGPLAPQRMLTCPAARLTMEAGMKNGEILRGPPLKQVGVLALDDVESADAGADVHAHPGGVLGRDFEPGRAHGFIGGGQGQSG